MNRLAMSLGLIAFTSLACASAGGVEAQRRPLPDASFSRPPSVNVWISGRSVIRHGDRVPVHFRADRDAYVTVVRIDTDGRLTILYPDDPYLQRPVRGGATYSVRGRSGFRANDRVGLGYVFAIASREPFDYSRISRGRRWDYMHVRHVRYDPFETMHQFAEMIAYDRRSRYALDFAEYHVGRHVPYPRYMCVDAVFVRDPYLHPCRQFAFVYRASPHPYGHARYYGFPARVIYVRQPVRYTHIEQKPTTGPGAGTQPGTRPANEVDRRRRAGDDAGPRGAPVNVPRRVETSEQRGTPAGTPAQGQPRRDPEGQNVEPSGGTIRRDDPRTAPRQEDDRRGPIVIRGGEPGPTRVAPSADERGALTPDRAPPRTADDDGRVIRPERGQAPAGDRRVVAPDRAQPRAVERQAAPPAERPQSQPRTEERPQPRTEERPQPRTEQRRSPPAERAQPRVQERQAPRTEERGDQGTSTPDRRRRTPE